VWIALFIITVKTKILRNISTVLALVIMWYRRSPYCVRLTLIRTIINNLNLPCLLHCCDLNVNRLQAFWFSVLVCHECAVCIRFVWLWKCRWNYFWFLSSIMSPTRCCCYVPSTRLTPSKVRHFHNSPVSSCVTLIQVVQYTKLNAARTDEVG